VDQYTYPRETEGHKRNKRMVVFLTHTIVKPLQQCDVSSEDQCWKEINTMLKQIWKLQDVSIHSSNKIIPDNGDQSHQHIYHNFYNVYWTCAPTTREKNHTNWVRSRDLRSTANSLKCLYLQLNATTYVHIIRITKVLSQIFSGRNF